MATVGSDVIDIGQDFQVPIQSVFGWIIWMKRTGQTYDWQLPWKDYKNGFGDSTGADFWLGLEKVHKLTTMGHYRLRIEMQQTNTGSWFSAEYWSFAIGDELRDKYRLNVAGLVSVFRPPILYHRRLILSALSICQSSVSVWHVAYCGQTVHGRHIVCRVVEQECRNNIGTFSHSLAPIQPPKGASNWRVLFNVGITVKRRQI